MSDHFTRLAGQLLLVATAGAVGAVVSVLWRMTSGGFRMNLPTLSHEMKGTDVRLMAALRSSPASPSWPDSASAWHRTCSFAAARDSPASWATARAPDRRPASHRDRALRWRPDPRALAPVGENVALHERSA